MTIHLPSIAGPLAPSLERLTDDELEIRLQRLAAIEHRALALLLFHLGEFDERRLHADRGHPSLFSYCLRVLGYSEQAAYKRIQAARAARAFPEVLQKIAEGELTLTAAVILAPHIRAENAKQLLAAARGKRTREIEALSAALSPRPDAADRIRAVPLIAIRAAPVLKSAEGAVQSPAHPVQPATGTIQPAAGTIQPAAGTIQPATENIQSPAAAKSAVGSPAPAADPRALIKALSARRYLFRFTGSSELLAKYNRVRACLSGRKTESMETLFEAGLDALLDKQDPERRLARRRARATAGAEERPTVSRTKSRARWISAPLRDAVWERDGGRCSFTEPNGVRCPSRERLEIDHIRPFALGGASDDAANLRLLCRAHNQLLARRAFGDRAGPRRRALADYP